MDYFVFSILKTEYLLNIVFVSEITGEKISILVLTQKLIWHFSNWMFCWVKNYRTIFSKQSNVFILLNCKDVAISCIDYNEIFFLMIFLFPFLS